MNRVSLFLADRARAIVPGFALILTLILVGAAIHPACAQQLTAGPGNVGTGSSSDASDNDYTKKIKEYTTE